MNRRLFEYVWRRNVYATQGTGRPLKWMVLVLLPMLIVLLALMWGRSEEVRQLPERSGECRAEDY